MRVRLGRYMGMGLGGCMRVGDRFRARAQRGEVDGAYNMVVCAWL